MKKEGLVLLLVLLSLISLISVSAGSWQDYFYGDKITGMAIGKISSASCTETDGGDKSEVAGVTTINLRIKGLFGRMSNQIKRVSDNCANAQTLREFYCPSATSQTPGTKMYTCPNGCANRTCKKPTNYSIDPVSPSLLNNGLLEVLITCTKKDLNGFIIGNDNCNSSLFSSKITKAYIYIKDVSGKIIKNSTLFYVRGIPGFDIYNSDFNYSLLKEEIYKLGIYVEDIYGTKTEIPDFFMFSGQGWKLCYSDNECDKYHSCINNKCMLKDIPNYQLGLVYVYNSLDTYNPNWRSEFEAIIPRVVDSIKLLTDNKVSPTIEILGEVQTDIFCWNPATVGGKWKRIGDSQETYFPMPGSQFLITKMSLEGWNITESYCNNCVIINEGGSKSYTINCPNAFTYNNVYSGKMTDLMNYASQTLSYDENNYDGVFKIFGKLGEILPNENNKTLQLRCNLMRDVIGGWASLEMAENSIRKGGLINCSKFSHSSFYDQMGWQEMVHEILHRFGAVDLYASSLGYSTTFEQNKALWIDPNFNQSVMGDRVKNCMENGNYELNGVPCTQAELNYVYLDKYNKQKIGINL